MRKTTGLIRFNVAERDRMFRGQDRSFDIPSVMRVINGRSVQERVKSGDMFGYFGHWPREKFGLDPAEGGILNGKQFSLEPAIRTTSIKAHPNGDIEHEIEFLDTSSGRIAARVYGSKAYGFSSAIRARAVNGRDLATDFFGFDLVKEPNYNTNRGYVLDSVSGEDIAILDEVADRDALFETVNEMLDVKQREIDSMKAILESLTAENTELISMLSKKTGKTEAILDGVLDVGRLPIHGNSALFDNAHDFLTVDLPRIQRPREEPVPTPQADAFFERLR
jgi:hypothetical protein